MSSPPHGSVLSPDCIILHIVLLVLLCECMAAAWCLALDYTSYMYIYLLDDVEKHFKCRWRNKHTEVLHFGPLCAVQMFLGLEIGRAHNFFNMFVCCVIRPSLELLTICAQKVQWEFVLSFLPIIAKRKLAQIVLCFSGYKAEISKHGWWCLEEASSKVVKRVFHKDEGNKLVSH